MLVGCITLNQTSNQVWQVGMGKRVKSGWMICLASLTDSRLMACEPRIKGSQLIPFVNAPLWPCWRQQPIGRSYIIDPRAEYYTLIMPLSWLYPPFSMNTSPKENCAPSVQYSRTLSRKQRSPRCVWVDANASYTPLNSCDIFYFTPLNSNHCSLWYILQPVLLITLHWGWHECMLHYLK